jgi:hypothetical protein
MNNKTKNSHIPAGFTNKKQFETTSKEELNRLQNMTLEQSISIMERLLTSGLRQEFKKIHKKLGISH